MRGAVLFGPRDVRYEDRESPRIVEPTDVVIRIAATCVCGSDLWPYRGLQAITGPTPMGHEYCGVVEEVGGAVRSIKPGQFVIGSFATFDNSCPNCRYGYQSSCMHCEFITHGGPAPVRRCLPELIDLVLNRKIDPGKVFDLTLPRDRVAEGYRAMDERRAIKTLLRP
jgi:threonine dehydrogenase-like Zn-dependent dehydrogenase